MSKIVICDPLADDWQADITDGLATIGERANNLTDFIKRYAKVARLPEPDKQLFSISHLIAHTSVLQHNLDEIIVDNDNDNDSDSNSDSDIEMQIFADQAMVEQSQWLKITDHGPGISNPVNLFVPFYSTKPKGSGIGLVLCQQILDKHKGLLTIDNLPEGGCQVMVTLPKGHLY